jgi:diguanylate cyclase (GGDEF)-like protein
MTAAARSRSVDAAAAFLDVPARELTPAVRAALERLSLEIEDLQAEVVRLKARAEEAEALAERDPLAPVLNRRGFMRELNRMMAFARRYETPLSVLYLDMDGFKAINDAYGHLAGDAALRTVGALLTDNTRESDAVGRLGGDEFAVALLNADLKTAMQKAEALTYALEHAGFEWNGLAVAIGGSFGARAYEGQESAEALLAEADATMFVRKRSRRA